MCHRHVSLQIPFVALPTNLVIALLGNDAFESSFFAIIIAHDIVLEDIVFQVALHIRLLFFLSPFTFVMPYIFYIKLIISGHGCSVHYSFPSAEPTLRSTGRARYAIVKYIRLLPCCFRRTVCIASINI